MTVCRPFVIFVFCVAALVANGSSALAGGQTPQTRGLLLSFNLASHHLNASQDFNEVNPGLAIGAYSALGQSGLEIEGELGFYHNSVGDTSRYATASLDFPVVQISQNIQFRMGGFGGFARYKGNADKLAKLGAPTFGNWVLAGGAQASMRYNNTDLRMRVMPAGKVATALFTFQMVHRF